MTWGWELTYTHAREPYQRGGDMTTITSALKVYVLLHMRECCFLCCHSLHGPLHSQTYN